MDNTKQKKPSKLEYQVSFNKLIFIALNEVLHDAYLSTKQTIDFDPFLLSKLRNLKPSLSKELKKDFKYLEDNGQLPVIQLYHSFCNVLFKIKEIADLGDPAKFENIIMILEAYLAGELVISDEKEIQQKEVEDEQ